MKKVEIICDICDNKDELTLGHEFSLSIPKVPETGDKQEVRKLMICTMGELGEKSIKHICNKCWDKALTAAKDKLKDLYRENQVPF